MVTGKNPSSQGVDLEPIVKKDENESNTAKYEKNRYNVPTEEISEARFKNL